MTRLLAIAEWLCGDRARRSTFEPLLADWDRERRDSTGAPLTRRAAIVVGGVLAFTSTLVACGLRHALIEGSGMWKYSLIAFAAAVGLSIASEMAIIDARTPADFPPDVLFAIALRIAGVSALATAMLPALLLLRRDPRTTRRTAVAWLSAGTLVAAGAVAMLPGPDGYQLNAEQNERMYQRALANDRGGRYQYPGTVSRQLREPSTPESRRASYERFLVQMNHWRAERPAPTPTPWQRLQRSSAPLLAVLFGAIGWILAGLVQPTMTRAIVWWAVTWFAMLAVDGRISSLVGVGNFRRPAWWALPVMTAIAALALTIVSTRRHRGTGTNPLGTLGTRGT